jgi:N-ethylmaleimide reductase
VTLDLRPRPAEAPYDRGLCAIEKIVGHGRPDELKPRLGALTLPNRIVMAPLGRARGDAQLRQPTDLGAQYYRQRVAAGLIISEATHVSADTVSRPGTTAIHTEGQVVAWRRITETVHLAGGRIF